MGEFEKDFILRQIRQLARVVAEIVLRARASGQYESALQELHAAVKDALGMEYDTLSRLDPASVALLARDAEGLEVLSRIASQEAELHEAAGDEAAALHLRHRAAEIEAERARRHRSRGTAGGE
jgi:hypothetical protein